MLRSKYIDHTLLKPEATKAQIEKLCAEAREYDFASVCINPCWIETAAKLLEGSDVKVCTVIGFPLGAMTTAAKVAETADAVAKGAQEIDMVINIGRLKDKDDAYVIEEIRAIKKACDGRILKVIIETCLLSEEEKVRACKDAEAAGADFVKTSTGFSKAGATPEDVRLMRASVSENVKVKAAGGVRSKADMDAMIEAGAERIGTSSGITLM